MVVRDTSTEVLKLFYENSSIFQWNRLHCLTHYMHIKFIDWMLVQPMNEKTGVVREDSIAYSDSAAIFWRNRGNQWSLTAYCDFRWFTGASDF